MAYVQHEVSEDSGETGGVFRIWIESPNDFLSLQNMSCNKQQIFHGCKKDNFQMKNYDIFLIFAQNIDCGYTLELIEAVLTSTHNLCFRAKVRKNVYPCKPQFFYIKVVCKGIYISRTCYADAHTRQNKKQRFYKDIQQL